MEKINKIVESTRNSDLEKKIRKDDPYWDKKIWDEVYAGDPVDRKTHRLILNVVI